MWTGRPELLFLLLALVARDGGCQEGSDEDDVCVLRSQVDLGLLGEVIVGVTRLGVELDALGVGAEAHLEVTPGSSTPTSRGEEIKWHADESGSGALRWCESCRESERGPTERGGRRTPVVGRDG